MLHVGFRVTLATFATPETCATASTQQTQFRYFILVFLRKSKD